MVLYILMVDTDFICIEYEISRARNKNTFLVAVVYETFFRNYHRCDSECPCVKNARVVTFDRYYWIVFHIRSTYAFLYSFLYFDGFCNASEDHRFEWNSYRIHHMNMVFGLSVDTYHERPMPSNWRKPNFIWNWINWMFLKKV